MSAAPPGFRGLHLARTFGLGLTIQASLSAANFIVGLILIRRTNDLQYSYYILATNALLLVTALQSSFVQPYIVQKITALDGSERSDTIGALVRANRRWIPMLTGIGLLLAAAAWATHELNLEQTFVAAVALLAGARVLSREFFRISLYAS